MHWIFSLSKQGGAKWNHYGRRVIFLRAGIVKNMGELNTSPWSGHSALGGRVERKWQDTKYILSFFGKGSLTSKRYLKFVAEGIEQCRRPELVGGGLIRSLGGWFEVLALRRRGEKEVFDQRILGDGDFVEQVLSESQRDPEACLRAYGLVKVGTKGEQGSRYIPR